MPPAHVPSFLVLPRFRTTNSRLNLPAEITDSDSAHIIERFDDREFYAGSQGTIFVVNIIGNRRSQAPVLSLGGSISILHLIIVFARVHTSALNMLGDSTPVDFCGFFCSKSPDASPPQDAAFMSTYIRPYGLFETVIRLGSPLLIALA